MSIRVMIAEDEKLAREELTFLLQQENDILLLPSASNGKELLELMETHQPQVIFLDMQMPEMEGIQAARTLHSLKNPPLLVFCTAYEDYAVEAFELSAVDYLLKPFEGGRLQETLSRVRSRLAHQAPPADGKKESLKLAKLLIDDGNRMFVIDPETIMYAVREDRFIKIHTAAQEYTSKMTLQQLEEKLTAYPFFRTHRSYLVNIHFVSEIIPWFNGAYNIVLKGPQQLQIPVSRSAARELLALLQN